MGAQAMQETEFEDPELIYKGKRPRAIPPSD